MSYNLKFHRELDTRFADRLLTHPPQSCCLHCPGAVVARVIQDWMPPPVTLMTLRTGSPNTLAGSCPLVHPDSGWGLTCDQGLSRISSQKPWMGGRQGNALRNKTRRWPSPQDETAHPLTTGSGKGTQVAGPRNSFINRHYFYHFKC